MRVTFDTDQVCLIPVCYEPDDAKCRVMCAAEDPCESYSWPEHEHGFKPAPDCNVVEWLLLTGVADSYDQSSHEPIPLYDGMPIMVSWDGDQYAWSPLEKDR